MSVSGRVAPLAKRFAKGLAREVVEEMDKYIRDDPMILLRAVEDFYNAYVRPHHTPELGPKDRARRIKMLVAGKENLPPPPLLLELKQLMGKYTDLLREGKTRYVVIQHGLI